MGAFHLRNVSLEPVSLPASPFARASNRAGPRAGCREARGSFALFLILNCFV